jgi:small subunit ribosomal protein S16
LAVRLRLRRVGKKKMPIYHIVAADSRAARNGTFLEVLGRYDPRQNPPVISASEVRVFYWLKSGAHPTDTVRSLFRRSGLWLRWNLTRRGLDEGRIATELEKWQMAQPLKHQREAVRRAKHAAVRKKAKKTAAPETPPAPPAQA